MKDFGTGICKLKDCGLRFKKRRAEQSYCTSRHRDLAAKRRVRGHRSMDTVETPVLTYRSMDTALSVALTASQGPSTGGEGFRGRLRLYLHDEAPAIGTGWRSLTVQVRGKRVRLLNHWTDDSGWVKRETFERLAAHSMAHGHSPTVGVPTSKLLVA